MDVAGAFLCLKCTFAYINSRLITNIRYSFIALLSKLKSSKYFMRNVVSASIHDHHEKSSPPFHIDLPVVF